MLKRVIPSSGETLGVVGVGTWNRFDVGDDEGRRRSLQQVLSALLDAGGSVVDSSPMYGSAEGVAGDLLAASGRRPSAFVATKVWTRGGPDGVSQMEDSFALLRTDVIDLMQIHNLVDWRTHIDTLRGWREEGRIRYLGYTHYQPHAFPDLMEAVRAEPVDFLQFCHAVDEPAAEAGLLPFCADNGIATLINRPFGAGELLSRVGAQPLPGLARELGCSTWAQLCLKYVISHPAVTCVIPGTGDPSHMADLVAAASDPLPDETTRARMRALV